MANLSFSQEEIHHLVIEIKNQLVPVLLQELEQKQLPPLLTRKEFMEMTGIGESKCAELFHRRDFPVNRELGYPRVPTKEFFEWIGRTTQNSQEVNMQYPYKVI